MVAALLELGGKDQVFALPQHPYTNLLMSSVPRMDATWLEDVLILPQCRKRNSGLENSA